MREQMTSKMTYQHKTTKEKIIVIKNALGDYVDENNNVMKTSELRRNYKFLKNESKVIRFNNTVVFQK